MTPLIAATSWPDAAVALGGITLVTAIIVVAIWQIFATGRANISGKEQAGYRKLAEDAQADRQASNELLERLSDDVADMRSRLGEVERMLKEVG